MDILIAQLRYFHQVVLLGRQQKLLSWLGGLRGKGELHPPLKVSRKIIPQLCIPVICWYFISVIERTHILTAYPQLVLLTNCPVQSSLLLLLIPGLCAVVVIILIIVFRRTHLYQFGAIQNIHHT